MHHLQREHLFEAHRQEQELLAELETVKKELEDEAKTDDQFWGALHKLQQQEEQRKSMTVEERLAEAEEESQIESQIAMQEVEDEKREKHNKLMARLNKRKQKHLAVVTEAQKKTMGKILALKTNFSDSMEHAHTQMNLLASCVGEGGKDPAVLSSEVSGDEWKQWIKLYTDEGFAYYWHPVHGSQWQRPDALEQHVFTPLLSWAYARKHHKLQSRTQELLESWTAGSKLSSQLHRNEELESRINELQQKLQAEHNSRNKEAIKMLTTFCKTPGSPSPATGFFVE